MAIKQKDRDELQARLEAEGVPDVIAFMAAQNMSRVVKSVVEVEDLISGSFNWEITDEGYDFWEEVWFTLRYQNRLKTRQAPCWNRLKKRPPYQGQDCIVLTSSGGVHRAVANEEWEGGFCKGDGTSGVAITNVIGWIPFSDVVY